MCTKVAEITHRKYDSGCRKRREKSAKLGAVTPDYVGQATEIKKKTSLHDENAIHLVFLLVVAISILRVVTVRSPNSRDSSFWLSKKKRETEGEKKNKQHELKIVPVARLVLCRTEALHNPTYFVLCQHL